MLTFRSLSSRIRLLPLVALLGLLSFVTIYSYSILSRPTISPEVGIAYLHLLSLDGWGDVFKKFFVTHEVWYRPFTFYFTNYVLFNTINFHDIMSIKLVSHTIILLSGVVVVLLADRIFSLSIVEKCLIFCLAVSHPSYYYTAIEGSGLTDPYFIIFIHLFLIAFITLLERQKLLIGAPVVISQRQVTWLVALACGLIFTTITSHERGLSIFLMIGGLSIYYFWEQIKQCKLSAIRVDKAILVVVGVGVLMAAIYVYFVMIQKQAQTGDVYRTNIDFNYILPNLKKAFEIPFRIMISPMVRDNGEHYYNVFQSIYFNKVGLLFLVAIALYTWRVFTSSDSQEKHRLRIMLILHLCTLPIPIICGNSPWHFYPAVLIASIVTGRAIYRCLTDFINYRLIQAIFLIMIFYLVSMSTYRGIAVQVDDVNNAGLKEMLMRIDTALKDKTLTDIPYMPEVVYYDTGRFGADTWSFGGQGNLFKYLYNNREITEIAISDGQVIASDKAKCPQAEGKTALVFGLNDDDHLWRKMKLRNFCADK